MKLNSSCSNLAFPSAFLGGSTTTGPESLRSPFLCLRSAETSLILRTRSLRIIIKRFHLRTPALKSPTNPSIIETKESPVLRDMAIIKTTRTIIEAPGRLKYLTKSREERSPKTPPARTLCPKIWIVSTSKPKPVALERMTSRKPTPFP